MEYPCLVYKVPGPHWGNYAYKACADAEEWEVLKAKGWHPSLDAARGVDAILDAVEVLEDKLDAITPPTRAELETKAQELGVSFNKRTRDEVLAQRIADAL